MPTATNNRGKHRDTSSRGRRRASDPADQADLTDTSSRGGRGGTVPTGRIGKSGKTVRTDQQIRAERMAAVRGYAAAGAVGSVTGSVSLARRTWRRLLPVYWAAAEITIAGLAGALQLRWTLILLVSLAAVAIAACWRAASGSIRLYRTVVTGTFGWFAVVTTAIGGPAVAPTFGVFGPALAAAVLGWPWWHYLRSMPKPAEPEPLLAETEPEETLTDYWADRWQREVVGQGVCTGTRLIGAAEPRPGVVEAVIQIIPGGTKRKQVLESGSDLEVALDLNEGAVGWRRTGRAKTLGLVIVERSYIENGVEWTGTSYDGGRCELVTFADGTPGFWTFLRAKFGTLNGLIVGSQGAGKSRALGVLIRNLLEARWMVVIGDAQNGQSLPDWKHAAGEYHEGAEAVRCLLIRLYLEVMARSTLLAQAGVQAFDPDDPRVQRLGLRPMMAFIDECQLVLIQDDRAFVLLVEKLIATDRKTGVGLVLATQIPQMKSLGGSSLIRDTAVAGNTLILRLSNRGSQTTILPDDFIGDPFGLLPETPDGQTTAGTGYLRNAPQLGMLARVPMLDEVAAAAEAPRTPVVWQVPPVKPGDPLPSLTNPAGGSTVTRGAGAGTGGGGRIGRLAAAFGLRGAQPAAAPTGPAIVVEQTQPASTREWILTCLRAAPASAQALFDRPDCPVGQAQLYAVLGEMSTDGGPIIKPARRGGPYTLA
jgi:hypothetical protein